MLVGRQSRTAAVSVWLSACKEAAARAEEDSGFSLDVTTARDHDPHADQCSRRPVQEEWEERSSCRIARGMRRQKVASWNDQERGYCERKSNQKGGVKRYTR